MTTTITIAELTGDRTITSDTWTSLTDLGFRVPSDTTGNGAITLLLNVPDGYAQGNNYPGTEFRIMRVQGRGGPPTVVAYGEYTYDTSAPQSSGRKPISVIRTVPHRDPESPRFYVEWRSVRGATSHLGNGQDGTPTATLTAIVAELA